MLFKIIHQFSKFVQALQGVYLVACLCLPMAAKSHAGRQRGKVEALVFGARIGVYALSGEPRPAKMRKAFGAGVLIAVQAAVRAGYLPFAPGPPITGAAGRLHSYKRKKKGNEKEGQ